MEREQKFSQFPLFAAVFLLSFCGLTLQIVLTRVFSATIWYHYAFVAVSTALFGWGSGGIFFYLISQRIDVKNNIYSFLSIISLVLSFSIIGFLWIMFQLPPSTNLLILYYLNSAIPFFLAGTCIAIVFHSFKRVSRIYFADLMGAAFGSLSVGAVLIILGAENAVLLVALIASIVSVLFSFMSKNRKVINLVLIGALIVATIFVLNVHSNCFTIACTSKPLYRSLNDDPSLHITFTKWNSFSRIDVVEGYGSSSCYLAGIYIDASAFAPVLRWDGSIENIEPYITNDLDYLPYRILSSPKTLIIGSGGGRDVVTALVGGSREVVAVEYNPIIVEVVNSYGAEAGYVYDNEKVKVIVDEGRSFISRSSERYDLIELYKVDSWAAIQAGGYALSENYLYTVEAFEQYYDHLSDNGVLMVVRWRQELPRLTSIVVEALQRNNFAPSDIGKHIVIIERPNMIDPSKTPFILMLKKNGFSESESNELVSHCSSDMVPIHVPFSGSMDPYKGLFEGSITLQEFYQLFPYQVEAVTDDSPYYFSFDYPYPKSLQNLMDIMLPLTLLLALIPALMLVRKKERKRDYFFFVVYFSAIGIGYMFVEIALVQSFILFLGHPTRALSVIIFSLLISSSIGSFVTGYMKSKQTIIYVVLASISVGLIAVTYSHTLPIVFGNLLSQSVEVRSIVSVVLLVPLGFVMGMPFPLGMREVKENHEKGVSWMWGVNGVMSVVGSIVATVVAIMMGLKTALFFAVLVYTIAFFTALLYKMVKQ